MKTKRLMTSLALVLTMGTAVSASACGIGFHLDLGFLSFGLGFGFGRPYPYPAYACHYGYGYPACGYAHPPYAYDAGANYSQPAAVTATAPSVPETPMWVPSTPGVGHWVPDPTPYQYAAKPAAENGTATLAPTVAVNRLPGKPVVFTLTQEAGRPNG